MIMSRPPSHLIPRPRDIYLTHLVLCSVYLMHLFSCVKSASPFPTWDGLICLLSQVAPLPAQRSHGQSHVRNRGEESRCCCRVVYTSNSRLHILDPSLHSCIPYLFMQLGLVIQQLNKIKFKRGSACTELYRTVCVPTRTLLQSNSTKVIANRSRGPGVPVTWALLAFSNTSAQHSSFDAPRGWVSRIRAVSHLYARGRCRTERTELLYSTVFSMDFLFLASI